MAVVDFSNAVLDVYSGKPMSEGYLDLTSGSWVNANKQTITTNVSRTVLANTPSKCSILFSGTFNSSGTEMYSYYDTNKWVISNISFSSGDTYAFVIDIETSGNT